MKKIILCFAVISLLASCSNSPREYFDRAALNCNMLHGFASYDIKNELTSPQEKLVDEKTMKMEPVTRAEVMKNKIARVEENYEKVKSLSNNDAAAEMLKASAALYEFVLPVYKNEYVQLAQLYDEKAAPEKIAAAEKNISEKYAATFEELYNNVIKTGTAYAEKNGIEVRQVNPTPGN